MKKKLLFALIPAIVLCAVVMCPGSPAFAAGAISGGSDTSHATFIAESPAVLNVGYPDGYFMFVPLETAQYTISSQSSSDPYAYLKNSSGTNLASNDDFVSLDFSITYTLTANTVYYLKIGDFLGYSVITLNITGGAILGPPQITSQPDSCSAAVGDTASFSISAVSPADLTYQWQVSADSGSSWASVTDGTGAAATSYTTPATTWAMDGYMYRCVVTNAVGSTTSDAVALTITKATPTITTSPSASALTYGDTLSASALTGGSASVPGTFAWADGTVVPTVSDSGTTLYSVTFTPTDSANYNTATTSVTLTVNKATPTITTVPSASALTYGDALSVSALTGGSANVPGTFAWANSAIKPTASGSGVTPYFVTFTPADSVNYNTATASVTLTVNKATYDMSGVTFSNRRFEYTGAARYVFISGTLPDGVSVSYSGNGRRSPGTYTVTASFSGDADNYQPIPDMTAMLTIRAASSEPTPTPSPSPSPSETPAPSESAATETSPTPVSTPGESAAAPSSAPSASAEDTAVANVSADIEHKDGAVILTIDTSTLPEGTQSLQLPDGSIIDIEAGAASVTVEVSESDIGSSGTVTLIALNDEGVPLSNLSVDAPEPAMASGFPSAFIWIIGIVAMAGIAVVLFLTLKKKAR